MEQAELKRRLEAILFAAGEPVEITRLAASLEIDKKDIIEAADALANALAFERRGIRVIRLDKAYQMVSSIGSPHNCGILSACYKGYGRTNTWRRFLLFYWCFAQQTID